jgi:hypothetical protein
MHTSKDIIPSPINPTGKPVEDAAERSKSRLTLLEMAEWLTRLTENPDFQRYIAFVREGAEATETQAADFSAHKSIEQGYALAQRFFGLHAMLKWPEHQLRAARAELARTAEQATP